MRKRLGILATASLILGLVAPALAASEPVVTFAGSSSATTNVSQTITASYSDPDGVSSCSLYVDGASSGQMSLSGSPTAGTASINYTFASNGTYSLYVQCVDNQGHIGLSNVANVTAAASATNTTPPTVGAVSPLNAMANASQHFSVSYSDNGTVSDCTLYVNGEVRGSMTLGGSASGTATYDTIFPAGGSSAIQARCTDNNGNVGFGPVSTLDVSGQSTAFTVGGITPGYATVGSSQNFAVNYFGNASVSSCNLYSDGSLVGAMGLSGGSTGTANFGINYSNTGTYSLQARCTDVNGNLVLGTTTPVVVSAMATPVVITSPVILGGGVTLEMMRTEADGMIGSTRSGLEAGIGRTCELSTISGASHVAPVLGSSADATLRASIENFTSCGTPSSLSLGAGERLGVVNSYYAAFGRWPTTADDWYDVMKIGQGRFPGEISASAEADAKIRFRAVYLRDADMNVTADANAVTVMAYGLRPLPRNLNSEAAAIVTFRAVYGRMPTSARDWDTVRAVAYSGATR